jgi:hypothetical protein
MGVRTRRKIVAVVLFALGFALAMPTLVLGIGMLGQDYKADVVQFLLTTLPLGPPALLLFVLAAFVRWIPASRRASATPWPGNQSGEGD